MLSLRVIRSLLVAITLLLPLAAQRSWLVDPCGSARADFTDLPPAVAAATAGDTIYVMAGGCSNMVTAPAIDKALTIVGVPGVATPGPLQRPWRVQMRGRITVTGVAAGQRLVLANLASSFSYREAVGLHAWDCSGELLLSNLGLTGLGFLGDWRCRFERCADVVLQECEFASTMESATFVDCGVHVLDSYLWAAEVSPYSWYSPNLRAVPAIVVERSQVLVVGGMVRGANGRYPNPWNPSLIYQGSEGANVVSGRLTVGPGAVIEGGTISDPYYPYHSWPYPSVIGEVWLDPRGRATGSLTHPAVVHATTAPSVIQNQPHVVTVHGPPGGFAVLAAGNSVVTPQPFGTGVGGLLAIDPGSLRLVGAAALTTAEGQHRWTFVASPRLPVNGVFAFQAGVIDPNGAITLSSSASFLVGWTAGQPF